MNNTNLPSRVNIDLAYTYTGDFLKNIDAQINNLISRVSAFLALGGVLLRFIIELSDTQPSYKLTKILAYITCFISIFLLGLALRSNPGMELEQYKSIINDNTEIFLKSSPEQAKIYFIERDIKVSEKLLEKAYNIKKLLNKSIFFIVLSAFFFTFNGLLVTFLDR
ncbi:MAG: hypothetical protein ACBR13_19570 [Microcoleus sp.]